MGIAIGSGRAMIFISLDDDTTYVFVLPTDERLRDLFCVLLGFIEVEKSTGGLSVFGREEYVVGVRFFFSFRLGIHTYTCLFVHNTEEA